MLSQLESESESIRFIASDTDSAYVCDQLDWPTILMKGNTLETIRLARFRLID